MNIAAQKLHAILFTNPLGVEKNVFLESKFWTEEKLDGAIKELRDFLNGSGLEIIEHEDRLTLAARKALLTDGATLQKSSESLSGSALEVLAIVAYRQPITKDEIAQIRGFNSEQSLRGLLEKNLIEKRSTKRAGINYTYYHTTSTFLQHMGLGSIADLPPLEGSNESSHNAK